MGEGITQKCIPIFQDFHMQDRVKKMIFLLDVFFVNGEKYSYSEIFWLIIQ